MTFLEQKLIEFFRACPDDKKFGILETARMFADLPDEDRDPASLIRCVIDSLCDSLSDDYKARLIRYAEELTALSKLPDPAPVPPPSASDPAPVQTSISDPDPEMIRAGQRMEQTAHKADVPKLYQMVLLELCYLHELTIRDGNEFNALCLAFDYGFVKGNRATRRGKVKAL